MEEWIVGSIGAFAGTVGFAYMLDAPRRTILPASLTALAGYLVYLFLNLHFGQIFSYFTATICIAVGCELEARMMRMPATIFLLTALVPLVPGYNLYRAMLALVQDDGAAAAAAGLAALQIVAAIAIAAAVTGVVFRSLSVRRREIKRFSGRFHASRKA